MLLILISHNFNLQIPFFFHVLSILKGLGETGVCLFYLKSSHIPDIQHAPTSVTDQLSVVLCSQHSRNNHKTQSLNHMTRLLFHMTKSSYHMTMSLYHMTYGNE